MAEITLSEGALVSDVHRQVSKSNFLGQKNTLGPHYTCEVGDLELFHRKLENAQNSGLVIGYEFRTVENKWLDVLLGLLPLIILIGLWIYFMRRMAGGGAGGAGSQILRDLGVQKIALLGSKTRYPSISGFGLEVVKYIQKWKKLYLV